MKKNLFSKEKNWTIDPKIFGKTENRERDTDDRIFWLLSDFLTSFEAKTVPDESFFFVNKNKTWPSKFDRIVMMIEMIDCPKAMMNEMRKKNFSINQGDHYLHRTNE